MIGRMMIEEQSYQVSHEIPEQIWDGFVSSEPWGSFLQHSAWARAKADWGWRAGRVALRRDGLFVAGAQLLYRSLPLGRSLAYIPRGPVAPPDDPPLLARLMSAIHERARRDGALLLTVEPPWPRDEGPDLLSLGFRPAPAEVQPSATMVLDLRPDEETLLAGMHQKWRYNIRLAGRREIVVREGSAADFERYHQISETTGSRDAFATRPRGYYEAVWRAFGENARLFVAEYEGEMLAGIIVVKIGRTATYLYGASSNHERKRMPNHALQWAAIQWARRGGCEWYDFWGIPPEVPADGVVSEPGEGGLWGVYRFKQGFGGTVVHYPGALDYPYSRLAYAAYHRWRSR